MIDESAIDPLAWEAAKTEVARVHATQRKLEPGDYVIVVAPTPSLADRGAVKSLSGDRVHVALEDGRTGTFPRSSLMWIGPRAS